MARTVYGDHERYKQTYFTTYPGYYFSGDGAYRDKEGYYQITGCVDDVINVTGHRLGTAEVEDVLVRFSFTVIFFLLSNLNCMPRPTLGTSVLCYSLAKMGVDFDSKINS